jgi:hypothetical protein
MALLEGEIVILNERAKKGLPNRIGERGVVSIDDLNLSNYQYILEFDDGSIAPVHETEVNRLTEKDKKVMEYIFTKNRVIFHPANEDVIIKKVDYLNEKAEVEFLGGGTSVVDFQKLSPDSLIEENKEEPQIEQLGKFTELAYGIGEFTDMKNNQYGSSVDATYKMVEVLMERYTYDEENYLIPKDLLKHLLLMVRVMDKQNRIFNNPSGKGDSESPWRDITGYGLIGIDMVEGK